MFQALAHSGVKCTRDGSIILGIRYQNSSSEGIDPAFNNQLEDRHIIGLALLPPAMMKTTIFTRPDNSKSNCLSF